MNSIGVVFTAFHRQQYFREAVESWKLVAGRHSVDFHTFLEPSNKSEEMHRIGSELGPVHHNEIRLGVLTNPHHAISKMFEFGYDRVIVTEEDIIVSRDILEYFSWAGDLADKHSDILGTCAFSPQGGVSPGEAFISRHFDPLCWSPKKSFWEETLRQNWFSAAKSPDGQGVGWDWGVNRTTKSLNGYWVTPSMSRSDHIGVYGEHMTPDIYETRRGQSFHGETTADGYFWLSVDLSYGR